MIRLKATPTGALATLSWRSCRGRLQLRTGLAPQGSWIRIYQILLVAPDSSRGEITEFRAGPELSVMG